MAIIKNTSIKRGDKLEAATLNQQFTDVNAAFTMDDQNVRNEGIDYNNIVPSPLATGGQKGLILTDANKYTISPHNTATTITSSTSTTVPPVSTVGAEITGKSISVKDNDVIRIYWQSQIQTYRNNAGRASSLTFSGFIPPSECWVMWLEWQINSSGAWTQPNGQSAMATTLTTGIVGALFQDTRASCLINSCLVVNGSAAIDYVQRDGYRGAYGSYYFKASSDMTIEALRLRIAGVYLPCCPTGPYNALRLHDAGPDASIKYHGVDISYLVMRGD